MRCWTIYPTGWIPCWAEAASGCRSGSGRGSGWAGHSVHPRRCCCSMSPPHPWTPAPRKRCCGPSPNAPAPVPRWWSSVIAGRSSRSETRSSRWPPLAARCVMRRSELAAWGLLRPRLPRILAVVALGVLSLGSALALAGVSACLITRAWQMPPVLGLSVAVVAVRTFAISRGVLHYCERLATHDTALRAAGTARAEIYRRLAHGPAAAAVRLPSGELVARVGADVDELADVLVRALIPAGVATVLAVASTAAIAIISLPAAAMMAGCLLIAGVGAPWVGRRAIATQEEVARQQHSERDTAAMTALEHGPELRVAGVLPEGIAESRRRQQAWTAALDAAARPAAVAQALPTAAIGASVLGAVVTAVALAPGTAPTTLAILMLLPLSAFEATTALPAAAVQLTRSRIAARRLLDLAGP